MPQVVRQNHTIKPVEVLVNRDIPKSLLRKKRRDARPLVIPDLHHDLTARDQMAG